MKKKRFKLPESFQFSEVITDEGVQKNLSVIQDAMNGWGNGTKSMSDILNDIDDWEVTDTEKQLYFAIAIELSRYIKVIDDVDRFRSVLQNINTICSITIGGLDIDGMGMGTMKMPDGLAEKIMKQMKDADDDKEGEGHNDMYV